VHVDHVPDPLQRASLVGDVAIGVVADEQRHPQAERVLASGHHGHANIAPQQRALHRFVVGVGQPADRRPTRFERLAHLLREVAGTHQEDAHGRTDTGVERSPHATRPLTVASKALHEQTLLASRGSEERGLMEIGKRFAQASALTATLAMAAIVGNAQANPLPPKSVAAAPGAMAAPAPEPAPAVPTFVNGLAQNVFSSTSSDWISGEVWVESSFDSDGDGKLDRLHADYTLPKETLTDGLKVPVIYEDSPYYGGTASRYSNWVVDHELGAQPPSRPFATFFNGTNTSPTISTIYESTWLPRGFAVVHSESPGSGYSDGCPSSGGVNETLGATNVIDWLNGRRKAYTSRTGTVEAPPVNWHNGHTAMMGTSYNGTIPVAAATTGVIGLDAIVPISAITDWYDYYRANGMVRAPHSAAGGTGNNSYLGEDLDVLIDDVYSRRDENAAGVRSICRPAITDAGVKEDRLTGNRNDFWQERNYMKDIKNVHAAALVAHGNNDFNVMTKNAAQFYNALKAQGVPHEFTSTRAATAAPRRTR
jgi:hypothetical protein